MTTTRRINDLITIENDEQDVEERVYKLAEYVLADYNKCGYNSDFNVTVSKGRKYYKIITDNYVPLVLPPRNVSVVALIVHGN